jgi:hypothetical protein
VETNGPDVCRQTIKTIQKRRRAIKLLGMIAVDKSAVDIRKSVRLRTGRRNREKQKRSVRNIELFVRYMLCPKVRLDDQPGLGPAKNAGRVPGYFEMAAPGLTFAILFRRSADHNQER